MATRRTNRRTNSQSVHVRKWTPEDEDVVIDEIGKNPTNMKACFLAASAIIGRSPSAITSHWYCYMARREDVCAKLTIGRHACVKNKARLKNAEEPKSIARSVFDGLIRLVFGHNRS